MAASVRPHGHKRQWDIAHDLSTLLAQISPGVVSIGRRESHGRSRREAELPSRGAGMVWSRPTGGGTLVLSNAHVVDALGDVSVAVVSAEEIAFSARVCAVDRNRDLALLHVSEVTPQLVPLGHSRSPVVGGQFVLAIGHPMGVRNAVTSGVVHSVGPVLTPVAMPAAQRRLDWLQVDVLLGPGNSGGPVLDAQGQVVGMSTMIAAGLPLAVPVTAIETFVNDSLGGVSM